MHKKVLSVGSALAWLMASGHAGAADMSPRGMICTAQPNFPGEDWTPPAMTATGLGEDVDKLAYVPNRLQSELQTLSGKGWTFVYGSASLTDRKKHVIYIQQAKSALTRAALLSHEVGHAEFDPSWDYSSKEAYLAVACLDEGHGFYENYLARDTTLNYCPSELGGAIDIGLAAAAPWDPYFELLQSWTENLRPANLAELGMLFCESNVTSSTGEAYLDYYGRWYDKNHGQTFAAQDVSTSPSHVVPEATAKFLKKIDQFAKAAASGMEKLMTVWPANNPKVTPKSKAQRAEVSGGRYQLDDNVVVSSSLIVPDGRNVVLASLSIEGICITRKDLEQYYPDLTLVDIPRPGMPNSPASWGAYGSWGVKVFTFYDTFNNRNPCLAEVTLNPTPTARQAFPDDVPYPPSFLLNRKSGPLSI
jgi:hypothetical protein